jgi:hypothetical protein
MEVCVESEFRQSRQSLMCSDEEFIRGLNNVVQRSKNSYGHAYGRPPERFLIERVKDRQRLRELDVVGPERRTPSSGVSCKMRSDGILCVHARFAQPKRGFVK